ncbi:MAG: hypothetical protein ABIO58_03170 [Luteimonas sp.]
MTCIKAIVLCAALTLAACGGNRNTDSNGKIAANGDAALPKPEAAGGSVTGMPDKPGPGQVGPPVPGTPADETLPPDTPIASDGSIVAPPLDGGGMPGEVEPPSPGYSETVPDDLPTPPGEPTPQDAVATVRNYYAAIDAHNYARAWTLWSDGGRASGQTPQQFADGFANTTEVVVRTDAPGRVDPAAGSRYIEVPVAISATQRDGSVRRYAGTYTLRRAVVDGATAEQRAWRIASADLREVKP